MESKIAATFTAAMASTTTTTTATSSTTTTIPRTTSSLISSFSNLTANAIHSVISSNGNSVADNNESSSMDEPLGIYMVAVYLSVLSILVYLTWRLFVFWCRYMLSTFENQYFTEYQINNHSSKMYIVERHVVKTEDGHELTLQRIVRNSSCSPTGPGDESMVEQQYPSSSTTSSASSPPSTMTPRHVIFMQHGLLETSGIFVLGPHSIAFRLAEAGYDIWLGNNRTSHYGQGKFNQPEHFQFSIDDLIKYDFPAMVNYIVNHTQCQKISFVGQSQGAGQCFGALSSLPTLKDKFHTCILLSPAIFLKQMPKQWLLKILMAIPSHWFGETEFLPIIPVFQRIMPKIAITFGGRLMLKAMGFIEKQPFTGTLEDVYRVFTNVPSGCTSVNNLLHWFELLRTGGCIRPFRSSSSYQIEGMLSEWNKVQSMPNIHIFLGSKDCVIDVEKTVDSFGKYPEFCQIHSYEDYGHTDFIWARQDDVTPIYDKIVNLMADLCP